LSHDPLQQSNFGHHVFVVGPTLDVNGDGALEYIAQIPSFESQRCALRVSVRCGATDAELRFWADQGKSGGFTLSSLPAYGLSDPNARNGSAFLVRHHRRVSLHAAASGAQLWSTSEWSAWRGLLSQPAGESPALGVLALAQGESGRFAESLVALDTGISRGGADMTEWGRSIPVGDFDGDGFTDAVRRCVREAGVALISGSTGGAERWFPTRARLSKILAAELIDVDRDGQRDFVLLAVADGADRSDLEWVSGANARSATTEAPAPELVAYDSPLTPVAQRIAALGDVDGDGFEDLAYLQRESTSDLIYDELRKNFCVRDLGAYVVAARSTKTGAELWRHQRGWVISLVSVADRDGDGHRDLVFVDDARTLRVLSARRGVELSAVELVSSAKR
jgi:hypothetical protein